MNKLLLFCVLLVAHMSLQAQKIDVDRKSGLVTANGRELCYIVSAKSNGPYKQFNVQNLQHQDIIFISENEGRQWDRETQSFVGDDFRVVFLATHNWCTAKASGFGFSNYQKIARLLVQERLVNDGVVVPESERVFIRSNKGIFVTRIEPGTQPAAQATKEPDVRSAVVSMKDSSGKYTRVEWVTEDQYIVNGQPAGTYSTNMREGRQTVNLYDPSNVKVATASRANDDWELTTLSDNRKVELRYDKKQPILLLFTYLVEKKYLTLNPQTK